MSGVGRARAWWLATGAVLGAVVSVGVVNVLGGRGLEPASDAPGAMEMSAPEAAQGGAGGMPGMDMGGSDGAETVRLTPEQIRHFGVTFGTVEERDLEAAVRAVAVVSVDQTRVVDVTPKFAGYVERLHAQYEGAPVRAGAPLLEVYAPDLVAAQEEVLLARSLQGAAGPGRIPGDSLPLPDLEASARRRLGHWDLDDALVDALLADGRVARTLTVESPLDGVVLERHVVEGSAFAAGQALFRLADLSEVWLEVELRETEAVFVSTGSRADVTLTAYPGERWRGRVDFVYPVADPRTRTVRARLVIPNPDGRVRPGMYGTAHVTTPRARALSVPADAVVWTGERTLLFVEKEPGVIRPVEAELGARVGDYAVVLSGAVAGQRVVASAQYLIDAEANIGQVMRSMMSMMGAGDMGGMDMSGMDMGDMDMGGMDMDSGASASPDTMGRRPPTGG